MVGDFSALYEKSLRRKKRKAVLTPPAFVHLGFTTPPVYNYFRKFLEIKFIFPTKMIIIFNKRVKNVTVMITTCDI